MKLLQNNNYRSNHSSELCINLFWNQLAKITIFAKHILME